MQANVVSSVHRVNGSRVSVEGYGQTNILKQFPFLSKGEVNIVVLEGFLINDNFIPFDVNIYAKRHR